MGIWDYLMRRKPLLLALLAVFISSGLIVSRLVQKTTTSPAPEEPTTELIIPAEQPGNLTVEPDTPDSSLVAKEPLARIRFRLANPEEVVWKPNAAPDSTPVVEEPPAESDSTIAAQPVDVPRTGRSPYATWYNIVVTTTVTLVVAFLVLAAARLIHGFYLAKR